MTREELIEELNKIKDITVEYYNDDTMFSCVEIHYSKGLLMKYYTDRKILYVLGTYFENRSEQQVLSAVKSLVGKSKKSNSLNFLPEIKITNVSNQGKFICFRVKGLDDGILVGLTHPELDLDDPKQGLGVGYKGEVKKVRFKIDNKNDDDFNITEELRKPVNTELVEKCKDIFDGIDKVSVSCIDCNTTRGINE